MKECVRGLVKTNWYKTNMNLSGTSSTRQAMAFYHTHSLSRTHTQMYDAYSTAGSVLFRIWPSRQVAIGPVSFVGPVGSAAVMLLIGRRTVFFVGAGLYVAAVIFRHLWGVNIHPCHHPCSCTLDATQVPLEEDLHVTDSIFQPGKLQMSMKKVKKGQVCVMVMQKSNIYRRNRLTFPLEMARHTVFTMR